MRSSGLVLLMCAGLLLSGGTILGASTAWSLLRMSYYFWTSDLGVELGSTVLFVAGSLLCLPACWLATLVPYHPRSQSLMATLMFLTTAALLLLSTGMSSLTALSRSVREPDALNASMQRAMALEGLNPAVKNAFASMQLELRCCGANSYADWYKHRRVAPPACCNRVWNGKRGDQCEHPLFTGGCLRPALYELRSFANAVSALASAMVIVMALLLFTGAYILVSGVIEHDARTLKAQALAQPMRLSCLTAHTPPAPPPPFAALTSPVALPNCPPM